jgi:hypothetical protein
MKTIKMLRKKGWYLCKPRSSGKKNVALEKKLCVYLSCSNQSMQSTMGCHMKNASLLQKHIDDVGQAQILIRMKGGEQ